MGIWDMYLNIYRTVQKKGRLYFFLQFLFYWHFDVSNYIVSLGNNYGGYYVRGPQVDYYDQREDSRMKYPSMLGLGRVLFKRNCKISPWLHLLDFEISLISFLAADIVTDPRFIKCLGDEGALGVPDVRIFAKCASFVGRPRFGKRGGQF